MAIVERMTYILIFLSLAIFGKNISIALGRLALVLFLDRDIFLPEPLVLISRITISCRLSPTSSQRSRIGRYITLHAGMIRAIE